jgi:signal transduction histidine kinase
LTSFLDDRCPSGAADRRVPAVDPAELVETAWHDLRAPLRTIRQALDALDELDEQLDGDDIPSGEHLGQIREATDRIDALAGALATLGRIECARLHVRAWSIDDLADDAAGRVRCTQAVPWTLVVEEPRATVVGDRALLVTMLEALFANTVEYRHPGRRPVVVVRVDDAAVEITDNGIGMEPRYERLVVEPFRRLHTRQEHPGSGLGLTIADRIARRHGGWLTVRATLDEATTVRVGLAPAKPPNDDGPLATGREDDR